MAATTPIPDLAAFDKPQQQDLDKCVHCGLCLSACPTYRELGVEMDSPRGRIYQMVQVAEGKIEINDDYIEHIDLCFSLPRLRNRMPLGREVRTPGGGGPGHKSRLTTNCPGLGAWRARSSSGNC